jgi:hypothetical protein
VGRQTWIAVPVTIFDRDQPRIGPTGAESNFAFVPPSAVMYEVPRYRVPEDPVAPVAFDEVNH